MNVFLCLLSLSRIKGEMVFYTRMRSLEGTFILRHVGERVTLSFTILPSIFEDVVGYAFLAILVTCGRVKLISFPRVKLALFSLFFFLGSFL